MSSNPIDPDAEQNNPLEGATACPHCGGIAKTSPHPELGHVCNICGAPRVEPGEVELSGDEKPHLEAARDAMRARTLWRVASLFGTVVSVFGLGVTALVTLVLGAGFVYGFSGVAMALPWIILAAVGYAKAKSQTKVLENSLEEAWKTAAREIIIATPSGVTASGIAEKLGLSEERAELLMAELSVDSMLQSRVTDDGRLLLAPSSLVRIDTDASSDAKTMVGDPLEERFAALEEAMAEEEAAAGEAKRQRSES